MRYFLFFGIMFITFSVGGSTSLKANVKGVEDALHNGMGKRKKVDYEKMRFNMMDNFIPQYVSFFQSYKFDNKILNTHISDYLFQSKRASDKKIAASVISGVLGFIGSIILGYSLFYIASDSDPNYAFEDSAPLLWGGVFGLGAGAGIAVPLYLTGKKNKRKALNAAGEIIRNIEVVTRTKPIIIKSKIIKSKK